MRKALVVGFFLIFSACVKAPRIDPSIGPYLIHLTDNMMTIWGTGVPDNYQLCITRPATYHARTKCVTFGEFKFWVEGHAAAD